MKNSQPYDDCSINSYEDAKAAVAAHTITDITIPAKKGFSDTQLADLKKNMEQDKTRQKLNSGKSDLPLLPSA